MESQLSPADALSPLLDRTYISASQDHDLRFARRNAKEVHKEALDASFAQHEELRKVAERALEIHHANIVADRLRVEREQKEQRLAADIKLAEEQCRLRDLENKARLIPKPAPRLPTPPPAAPEPPPAQSSRPTALPSVQQSPAPQQQELLKTPSSQTPAPQLPAPSRPQQQKPNSISEQQGSTSEQPSPQPQLQPNQQNLKPNPIQHGSTPQSPSRAQLQPPNPNPLKQSSISPQSAQSPVLAPISVSTGTEDYLLPHAQEYLRIIQNLKAMEVQMKLDLGKLDKKSATEFKAQRRKLVNQPIKLAHREQPTDKIKNEDHVSRLI